MQILEATKLFSLDSFLNTIKPDFLLRISLVAGETFVRKKFEKQMEPKFLLLISEIVVSSSHLP